MVKIKKLLLWAAISVLLVISPVGVQVGAASDAAQANNPLADIRAFNIQNYYYGKFTGPSDKTGNQLVARYAQPVQLGNLNVLMRASLPFNSFPVGAGGQTVSSVGDFDVFAAVQIDTGNPAVSFAIGPQLVVPTATDSKVGSDQWQLGLANVYFNAESAKLQYGYLLTWRSGIGNTNGRSRANLGAFQPFVFYQMGDGYYTGGAPIWSYNFENENYSVPLGLRFGKVFRRGNTVFNFFAEPQYSVFSRGNGLPKWQVYFALNMQFR